MNQSSVLFVLVALVAGALALPLPEDEENNQPPQIYQRLRRSPDGWELSPHVGSDSRGVNVGHSGDDHDFRASYLKGRRGEDWHIGGTWRFKRSPDGWELSPHVGSDSRGVNVEHSGDDHDFRASYLKGRRGEDWHIGGTFRFKRSPDGWVLRPDIGSDGGSVQVGHEGDNHDFRAIYSKGNGGEDWHVGGTFRW